MTKAKKPAAGTPKQPAAPKAQAAKQQSPIETTSPPPGNAPAGAPGPREPVVQAAAAPAKAAKAKLPESVTLDAPHGFIDEDERNRHWHAGAVVTDPDEIQLLIERKAPLVGINHDEV